MIPPRHHQARSDGTPEEVVPPLINLVCELAEIGIDEIAFSKLGYDYKDALELIAKEVIPHLR
jgi:hypothetical protein